MRPRTILKGAACTAGALLLVLAAFLAALVLRPGWFLNTAVLERVIDRFGEAYRPSWSSLSFNVSSLSLFEKELDLETTDFCFRLPSGAVSGCLDRLDLVADVRLSRHAVSVARVARLVLDAKSLRVDTRVKAAKPAKKRGFPSDLRELVPAPLRGTRWGPVQIRLAGLEIEQSSAALTGDAEARYRPDEKTPLTLSVDLLQRAQGGPLPILIKASASSVAPSGARQAFDVAAFVSEGAALDARLKARIERTGAKTARVSFTAQARRDTMRATFAGSTALSPEKIQLDGALKALLPSTGPVSAVSVEPLRAVLTLQSGTERFQRLVLGGRFQTQAKRFTLYGVSCPAVLLSGHAALDAEAAPRPGRADAFEASASLSFDPVGTWILLSGGARARLAGRLGALNAVKVESSREDITARVPHFSDLVKYLAGTVYAIPAPLDALAGTLSARLSGNGRSLAADQRVDYTFASDLSGGRQKLKVLVDGDATLSGLKSPRPKIGVRAGVRLLDVAVQLPPLSVQDLPALSPDQRIHHGTPPPTVGIATAAARSPFTLALDASVRTSTPALIYSNLAATPIPVVLDLSLESPPSRLSGTVQLKTFQAKLFRRVATIDAVVLTLTPHSKQVGLDARVTYRTPAAVIYIRILGTTEKPQVTLLSEPPYTRSEIISLLLFGEPPDQLDPDQQASVGNTQSAFSEDAFGLASLYLFASTPIEYVGYDPATRDYSVRFRLPIRSSLSLGSNQTEEGYATLRTRLAPHWAVQTQVGHSETEGNIVTTLLEWYERY